MLIFFSLQFVCIKVPRIFNTVRGTVCLLTGCTIRSELYCLFTIIQLLKFAVEITTRNEMVCCFSQLCVIFRRNF